MSVCRGARSGGAYEMDGGRAPEETSGGIETAAARYFLFFNFVMRDCGLLS